MLCSTTWNSHLLVYTSEYSLCIHSSCCAQLHDSLILLTIPVNIVFILTLHVVLNYMILSYFWLYHWIPIVFIITLHVVLNFMKVSYISGHSTLDPNLIFSFSNNPTRGHELKLEDPRFRTNKFRDLMTVKVCALWNTRPREVVYYTSV